MKFSGVESSNLSAIGYDSQTHTLGVLFRANTLYFYCGVPQKVYDDFLKAESLGKFFNTIKSSYNYFQVDNLKPVDLSALVNLEPVIPASDATAQQPSFGLE